MKKTIYPIMFLSLALISGCNKNPSSSVEDKDSYLVSYYSEDNSLLYQDHVKKGASSLYNGDEPTKNHNMAIMSILSLVGIKILLI